MTEREEAIVRAALERAAAHIAPHPNRDKSDYTPSEWVHDRQAWRILALASNPEAVAEIINTATQFTAATKENKQ